VPGLVPGQEIFPVKGTATAWYVAGKGSWLVVLLVPSKMLIASVGLAAVLTVMYSLTFRGLANSSSLGELDVGAARWGH